jgi:hypothetical protein
MGPAPRRGQSPADRFLIRGHQNSRPSHDAQTGSIRYRTTLSRIARASDTLSAIVEVSFGDGPLISSRAIRTAAMMLAAITNVDAKRSCLLPSCSSRATARRISPMVGAPSGTAQAFCRVDTTAAHGRCPAADSVVSPRREDNRRRSRCQAWSALGQGCSRRSPCSGPYSRKRRRGKVPHATKYRRKKGEIYLLAAEN